MRQNLSHFLIPLVFHSSGIKLHFKHHLQFCPNIRPQPSECETHVSYYPLDGNRKLAHIKKSLPVLTVLLFLYIWGK